MKIIHVPKGGSITGANRFTTPPIPIVYDSFDDALREARCVVREPMMSSDVPLSKDTFLGLLKPRSTQRFEVVRFSDTCQITADYVWEKMMEAKLRPATFPELLSFIRFTGITSGALVALGESDVISQEIRRLQNRSIIRKLLDFLGVFPVVHTPHYASVDFGVEYNLLALTKSCHLGWQDYVWFLGVHTADDSWLIDLPITLKDYEAMSTEALIPSKETLGRKFRHSDGYICEVVPGGQMLNGNWSHLCVPDYGLRNYQPVWIQS